MSWYQSARSGSTSDKRVVECYLIVLLYMIRLVMVQKYNVKIDFGQRVVECYHIVLLYMVWLFMVLKCKVKINFGQTVK